MTKGLQAQDEHSDAPSRPPMPSRPKRGRQLGAVLMILTLAALAWPTVQASAQGWQWPWDAPQQRPPVPREPVYRPPPAQAPPPAQQGGWENRAPICLQLEQRLVQESQRGSSARDQLPTIENDIRQAQRRLQQAQIGLERRDCYESEFLFFGKTLRRTRQCVDLSRQAEQAQQQLRDLESQRQQVVSSDGRSYQDEIIRELARNNCGPAYQQEARRRDNASNPFSAFWNDGESDRGGGGNYQFGKLPFATYRTICVRLCDGYYFPVSFSTLPNHFQRDAEACQSKCAAPAELYYYPNPGGSLDQAMSMSEQKPYTSLRTAFKYRKELVQGCSCKQAEFVPLQGGTPAGKRAEATPPAQGGGAQSGGVQGGAQRFAQPLPWQRPTR